MPPIPFITDFKLSPLGARFQGNLGGSRKPSGIFIFMGTYRTYIEKLRDPRWQRLRLKCLEKSEWTCSWCSDKKSNLQVHHGYYRKSATPWSYPQKTLHVLCDSCHGRAELEREELYRMIASIHPRDICAMSMMLANSGKLELSSLKFDTSNDGSTDTFDANDPEWNSGSTEEELKNFFGDLKSIFEREEQK